MLLEYFRIQKALSGGTRNFLQDLNSTYGSGVLTSDFEPKRIQVLFKMADEKLFLVSHGYSR